MCLYEMYEYESNINALIISLCVFNMGKRITVCVDTLIYNQEWTLQVVMNYKH